MQRNHRDYQSEIGKRIKQYRINMGLTQQDLEVRSGVSVRSISRLEQGSTVQFESIIKVLIALNLADNLDMLIPDQTKRPSYYLEGNRQNRQRARKTRKQTGTFKWGDE